MNSTSDLQNPRYRWPLSESELKRRLTAFQRLLRDQHLDCAVMQSQSTVLDGVIRYFIDQPTGLYSSSLLIPAEGEILYLCHGNLNRQAPIPNHVRQVEKMIALPYCQMFNYTDGMIAGAWVDEIRMRGFKRVGYLYPQLMSYDVLFKIQNELSGVVFTDITSCFDRLRAVKSETEWMLIERSVAIHDRLMQMVPALLKPGIMEYELRARLAEACVTMGCDAAAFVAVGSAPQGEAAHYTPHFACNRRIERGDNVNVMIEICGPGGLYGELSRTFTLGKPGASILRLFDIAKRCQAAVAEAVRPGVSGAEVNEIFDAFAVPYGIAPNTRFVGHGMGYDMMEAPAINAGETMTFESDMYIVIHPELSLEGEFATCSDNFRVTEQGAVRLSSIPQEIICL